MQAMLGLHRTLPRPAADARRQATAPLPPARPAMRAATAWLAMALACAGCAIFPAHSQSLVQLTEQAQAFDANWRSQRAALDAAISRGAQAKAGLLPQAGVQLGSQYSDTRSRYQAYGSPQRSQLDARQDTAALQATQPLYNPSNWAMYRQGQRSVDLAYAQTDAAAQDLLVRTAQAYFRVLEAQDSLSLVQAQKKAVSTQFEFAQRNFDIGTATITDAREAQSRLDLVLAQEIAADNELQVRRAALAQLTGHDTAQPWPLAQPVQLPALQPAALGDWLDTALQHSPSVRQAQLAVQVAALEIDKAQAGHKPTVDLQASYAAQRNPDGTAAAPTTTQMRTHVGTVGVVMNLPLFAGFAVQNRVRETVSLHEQALADLDHAQRQVAQTVRTAFWSVQSGYGQVKALEAAVASSQSALDANLLGYEVGVRINMDVLNAQSQLYQAQKELAQARYNVLVGQLQLRQAAGVLSMQDVHALNALLTPAPTGTPLSQ